MTEPSSCSILAEAASEGIGARRRAPTRFSPRPPCRWTAVSLEPLRYDRGAGAAEHSSHFCLELGAEWTYPSGRPQAGARLRHGVLATTNRCSARSAALPEAWARGFVGPVGRPPPPSVV
jgi:hypothetical protein